MTFETWLLFLVVGLAPALSPGPGMLFAITTAVRYGAAATVITGLSNAVGLVAVGLAVGLGLGAVMATSAIAFLVLKLVGAAYLVWLGVKVWRDRSSFVVDPSAPAETPKKRRLVAEALAISLTNPKAVVLIAALFPPFMNPAAPAFPQVVILAVSYAALCAGVHLMIALAGHHVRRFLASPRRASALRRALGAGFIGFGAALAAAGRP